MSANGIIHKLKWKDDKVKCVCGLLFARSYMQLFHATVCKALNDTEAKYDTIIADASKIQSRPKKKHVEAINIKVDRGSGLIICKTCHSAIPPNMLYNHAYRCRFRNDTEKEIKVNVDIIRKAHRYLLTPKAGALNQEEFEAWYKKRSTEEGPSIPGIKVFDDGYWCNHCTYAAKTKIVIGNHLNTKHMVGRKPSEFTPGSVQQIISNGRYKLYMRVSESAKSDHDDDEFDA
ncbi:hypothetical protein LPJ66_000327 [Kickxella alabastrina]|uniref:Uncharacterized protein n=1 Tax=Kickxella alabastrina TaxID=61397 RepID=A0ACC1IW66_9FUNG|nr:hypothetical protein LPJ66_000327 [Kickxella alabastrina]